MLHIPDVVDADLGSAIEGDHLDVGMLSLANPEALGAMATGLLFAIAVKGLGQVQGQGHLPYMLGADKEVGM
jgi:hypothetical protein